MKYRLALLLTLCFSLVQIQLAEAGKHRRGMGKEIISKLDLNEDQKAKLKDIRSNTKSKLEPIRKEKKAIREKMKAALQSNASDSELRALHSSKQELRNKMATIRFNKMLEIRKILTLDQRQKTKIIFTKKSRAKPPSPS